MTVDLDELERLEQATWRRPWSAHTFEIDCPCPNGVHCGDWHTCDEVEAPDEYPGGQCVVQIDVPGLERFAGPTAAFIAATRNALPGLIAELRAARALREACQEWSRRKITRDYHPIEQCLDLYRAATKGEL